ncbi:MAG: hypothetical protein QGG73_08330, partial [Candidatus Hydrogenedentes bacterium]|nr:hypothetical protein [Candidatus Hydrogenedentota bacterium]
MGRADKYSKVVFLSGCALFLFGALPIADAQEESVEEKTKIQRMTSTDRAIYDAFAYVNRIPEKKIGDATPIHLVGRIFGRLANQEGRILLKLPKGMDREAYFGYKTFLRYEGNNRVGNCVACHALTKFTDTKEHVVAKGGSPVTTPSLRNLKERDVDVAEVIKGIIAASEQKRAGKADDIDDEYGTINITEKDIPGLVKFIDLLNDVPESGFRDLILGAE